MPTASEYLNMARQAEQSGDMATAQKIYDGLKAQGYDITSAPGVPQVVDDGAGLPFLERARLSGLTDDQQESYLEQHYGKVHRMPSGDLAVQNADGQFIRVDPKGFDTGDIADVGREIFQTVAGAAGSVAGGAVASPTVAGIPAGAVVGGAAGSTGGGELYDALVRYLSGEVDDRTAEQIVKEVGTSATIDLVAPVVVSKAGGLVKTAFNKMLASKAGREVAEAGARQNVDPSAGMVGIKPIALFEGAVGTAPFGSANTHERVAAEIGDTLSTKLNTITNMESPEQIGSYVRERVTDYVARFKGTARDKYNAVSELIPHNERFDYPSTGRLVRDRIERYADDPKFAEVLRTPFGRRLEGLLEQQDVSFQALNALRSEIGDAIASGDTAILAGASVGDLKQLYKVISQDLERGIAGFSSEALSRWKEASDYYRTGATLLEDHVQPLIGKGIRPEDIAVKLINQSKRGGTTIAALVDGGVLDADDVEKLGAAFMRRAALPRAGAQSANPDAFSPHTFSTEISKLSPEAREALFQGQLADDLDDLLLLSNAFKDATANINRSGTAGALNVAQLGGGGAGALATLTQGNVEPLLTAGSAAFGIPAAINMLLQNPITMDVLTNGGGPSALFREYVGLLVAEGFDQALAEQAATGAIQQLQKGQQAAPAPAQPAAQPPMTGQPMPPQGQQAPVQADQASVNPYMAGAPARGGYVPPIPMGAGPKLPIERLPQLYQYAGMPDLPWFIG